MTQPTALEQIDLLLAAWDERLRRMSENLVALESEAIYQILAGKAGKRPALAGVTWDTLKTKGWAQLKLAEAPFAEGGFHTPSGKCEFFSERLQRAGLEPVPDYLPPYESAEYAPTLAARFPLAKVGEAHALLEHSPDLVGRIVVLPWAA